MKTIFSKILSAPTLTTLLLVITAILSSSVTSEAAILSGFVKDRAGAPVIAGDLDFDRAFDNLRIFTPGDNTDINGFYNVLVAPNIYHVSFAPPLNSHLLGKRFFNLDLRSGIVLDVVLDSGVVITGTVTDALGLPIIGVINLDVDSIGGGRVYTPAGKTDSLTGQFWIVVPRHDKYRLRFKPPAGLNFQLGQIDSISIQNDTTINITLIPGIPLTGVVTQTNGDPVPLTQISLKRTSDGVKLPLANNKTDSLGLYTIIAPADQYALQFAPPLGQPLVAVEIDSFTLTAPATVNVTMNTGTVVSVTVNDIDGFPLENADLDVSRESDSVRLFTPHDKTDSNGIAILVLPPDIYQFKADPPLGLLLDKAVIRNIPISLDTSLIFMLNPLSRITITGRIVNSVGLGIPNIAIEARSVPEQLPLTVKRPLTDSAGFFNAAVPIGTVDLLITPPRDTRFIGRKFPNITLTSDSALGVLSLEKGILVTAHVINQSGVPESNYRIEFNHFPGGATQFTPHDSVDILGNSITAIPPGTYIIGALPELGFPGETLYLDSADYDSDVILTLVIGSKSTANPETFILRQNYPNPFNGITKMPYLLNQQENVTLSIYNVLGQTVKTYEFRNQQPGYYTPSWDGADSNGGPVASGVYFYRLKTSNEQTTKTMLFIQ